MTTTTHPSFQLPTAPRKRPRREFGFHVGSITGIEIRMDLSVLIIALLVSFNLTGLLAAWHPDWGLAFVGFVAVVSAALLIGSILVHELAHALVGRRFGLPVERITLFIFGGMAELGREPDRPKVELLTALAGPAASLVLGAGSFAAGLWLAGPLPGTPAEIGDFRHFGAVATVLLWLGPTNVLLGLFNLVPGFPLDGGRVVRALMWWKTGDLERATRWASRGGQLVAGTLVVTGVLMIFGYRVPVFGVGLGSGLWLILIGWFLNMAAVRSYEEQTELKGLEGVSVGMLMLLRFESVPGNTSVGELERRFLHSDQRCFPVMEGGAPVGLVCLDDLRRVAKTTEGDEPITTIMTPWRALTVLSSRTPARDAMRQLVALDVEQLPVMERGNLVGFVRRRDILKWLALRAGAPRSVELDV
jgi:Zn-dependent protease/CBS domain-containing protein